MVCTLDGPQMHLTILGADEPAGYIPFSTKAIQSSQHIHRESPRSDDPRTTGYLGMQFPFGFLYGDVVQ